MGIPIQMPFTPKNLDKIYAAGILTNHKEKTELSIANIESPAPFIALESINEIPINTKKGPIISRYWEPIDITSLSELNKSIKLDLYIIIRAEITKDIYNAILIDDLTPLLTRSFSPAPIFWATNVETAEPKFIIGRAINVSTLDPAPNAAIADVP